MSNHVLVRLEMVLVSGQDRCMVCTKHSTGPETVLDAPMVLLGDEAQAKACFGLFRHSASPTQDRCMVCAERTIGLENVLDASMVIIGDEAQVQARFGLFRDSTNLDAR